MRTPPQDITNAVSVLSEALMADPQFNWVFPESDDRRTGQALLYRSMAEQAARAGRIQLAGTSAAALWIELAAGESPFEAPEPGSPSHPVLDRNAEKLGIWASALARHHPTATAHLYLGCIGVLPDHHGKGIGGKLLRDALEDADLRGLPAYLEATTERSRGLYLRHGFTDLGEPIRIADAPPLWPMWREATAKTTSTTTTTNRNQHTKEQAMTTERRHIAGNPNTFMTVEHLTVSGSQRDIGQALAAEAARAYVWQPMPVSSKDISRARRAWFQANWPEHYQRMEGAARFAGVDLESDEFHLDGWTGIPQGSGCSVLWSPPDAATGEPGLVGRNYDFFTSSTSEMMALVTGGSLENLPPELPISARPFVVNCRPDDGLASVFLTMNDLSGCMDGINEAGLMITLLLADAENAGVAAEVLTPQVGIESVQVLRYILDRCSTVEEAKAAILAAKVYTLGPDLHYLIADAAGNAFVWERSPAGQEHIIDADGEMCVTNHLLHRHPQGTPLPEDNAESMRTYSRNAHLQEQAAQGDLTQDGIRKAVDEVLFTEAKADGYPVRTLWRTIFDVTNRTIAIRFYMGDSESGEPLYSAETTFSPVQG